LRGARCCKHRRLRGTGAAPGRVDATSRGAADSATRIAIVRITRLKVSNFRSFVDMDPIELGRINVFIGPNNAGKSSLLRAAYLMQSGPATPFADVRLDAATSSIEIGLADIRGIQPWGEGGEVGEGTLRIVIGANPERTGGSISFTIRAANGGDHAVDALPPREPHHAVVPYLSRRKSVGYQEDVREQHAVGVSADFSYLAAKLSRLGNYAFPAGERYRDTCKAVLGFVVTAVPSLNGQRPGVYLPDRRAIPLEQMGEGVPNIAGLLADLALAENKILLIEEPENDLHPQALRGVLDLIEASAESNQFLVSTHSNIVARHLGSADDSRLFYVDTERGALPPIAHVRPVSGAPESRLAALRELGYRFSDFDLWDGWLILEESSAERIIRDYLIPWFAPKLVRVRTLAAGGTGQVEPTFEDFHRLVRFTHLEHAYRNFAWVRVDGDEVGQKIVRRLRERYPAWASDRFGTFSEAQFERYYPERFQQQHEAILAVQDRHGRREAKRELLDEVRSWLDEDQARARAALATSAASVIADLKQIEAQLTSTS
jgi:hypothetical protein